MVDTVGLKLQKERQHRKISVEEAARATRMRPDKIADLEKDNYTNFPNMTYAKGFLLIYAKFLEVDVSEFVENLEKTNPVGIEDYEYLNAAERRTQAAVYRPPRKPLLPLVIGSLVLLAAVMVIYFILTLQRLGPQVGAATPTPAPSPTAAPAAAPAATRTPLPVAAPPVSTPPPRVLPNAVPDAKLKDLVITPAKKTWVKITRDVADSAPIFEDWLYPDALPLKLRGMTFWIEAKDPAAVKITRDGLPVTMDGPAITIQ